MKPNHNYKFVLPCLITAINMVFGLGAIFLCIGIGTYEPAYILASWLIIAAAIADGLDGKVARMTQTSSEFGIQFDSLADLVAFGVAPSVLLYTRYLADLAPGFILFPILMILCGAVRLARYNVHTDGKKKAGFEGMPIPVFGGSIANFTLFVSFLTKHGVITGNHPQVATAVLSIAIFNAILMVSTIPYPVTYRFFYRNFNMPVRIGITAVLLTGIKFFAGPVLFSIYVVYALEGIFRRLFGLVDAEEESGEEDVTESYSA